MLFLDDDNVKGEFTAEHCSMEDKVIRRSRANDEATTTTTGSRTSVDAYPNLKKFEQGVLW